VGRPILKAPDPAAAARAILSELQQDDGDRAKA
jgi:orotidine-5'-phosphate decarboxylase